MRKMNPEEKVPTIQSLTPSDRKFLKNLNMAPNPWIMAAKECAFKGWMNRVGRWHVLTPAGLQAMTRPTTLQNQLACLHLLAGVPDRRCLGRLEELGLIACEAGFPLLTPLGASTAEALRAAEIAKKNDFGSTVIAAGERYGARGWRP